MKNYQVQCPYCGSNAILRSANKVFGAKNREPNRFLYVCSNWPTCDSDVMAHLEDLRPMGTMANGSLRHKRILAHKALQAYRKASHTDKWASYIWLEGKWDAFEGQFFAEFTDDPDHYADRRWTHVIEPFDIPRSWRVYRSYDFGYAKPFSCAWWAVDYDGVIYRILELYGCTDTPDEGVRWTPERQFQKIREIEDSHPWLKGRDIQGVADPAIWDTSRGESIYETALRYRIYFTKGDNRRIPGWMQMHYRLGFDDEGYPMMYVFRTCRAFLRTVPALLVSGCEVEDLDTHQEDHVADECRYFCMSRPLAPRREQAAAELGDDPLNMRMKK